MPLNDWEFSYNGLTFGGNTAYGLITVEGLNPPDARIDEVEKAGDHGSFIYAQFLSARTITITGDVMGTTAADFEDKINALRAAFAPQLAPLALSMAIPGSAAKCVFAVPTKVQFPVDISYSAMLFDQWTVELMAGDPRLYSDTGYGVSLFPTVANGIGFNIAFNLSFGGTTGGGLSNNAFNGGSFPSLPVVNIHGPVTNPKLRNITTGASLSLDRVISATQNVIIDFAAKTVMLGGGFSIYSSLRADSNWWSLQPGNNTLEFSGDLITGSTQATVAYRYAWN